VPDSKRRASLAGGVVAAEKLRRLVELHRFEFDGTRIAVTVSLGLTCMTPNDGDPLEIIRRADERLYEAKRGGRNSVRS
jgi:diguanylate cyclase